MKIYDISKGYFTAPVYPGDPVPRLERLQQMQLGDKFNLTAYYGGAHAATHMDAPRHFVDDGATIDQVPLEACFGPCTVLSVSGILTGEDADEISANLPSLGCFCAGRGRRTCLKAGPSPWRMGGSL